MATKTKTISWPLVPAPESKDHFTLKAQYDLFIGGKWVKPKSGNAFDNALGSFLRHAQPGQ